MPPCVRVITMGPTMNADVEFPPLEAPLALIAARMAVEGIPVRAIARCLARPSEDVRTTLTHHIEIGGITEMPKDDWPPTGKRADRLPSFMKNESETLQLFSIQRALKLTRLEASFMLVFLKRDEAEKETLHYVIETQRALRQSRPNNPEPTDPKMVDVVICKMRKKFKPLGLTIHTLWGHGYYIDDAGRKIVEDLLASVGSPTKTGNANRQ